MGALNTYFTIHKRFVMKPNPYVTKEEAQSAYINYTCFNWLVASGSGRLCHYGSYGCDEGVSNPELHRQFSFRCSRRCSTDIKFGIPRVVRALARSAAERDPSR